MIDAEPEEDETSAKLGYETNANVSMVSDDELVSIESGAPRAKAADILALCYKFAATVQHEPTVTESHFEVHFSDDGPEDTFSAQSYKKLESFDIDNATTMMKSIFTKLTMVELEKKGIAKEECMELAQLVMAGGEVEFLAFPDYSSESIYNNYRRCQEIKSYQCLLIRAPLIGDPKDSQMHEQQMINFCLKAFPMKLSNAAELSDLIMCGEVSSAVRVRELIQEFFRRKDEVRAKRALHALIVFFGHGVPQGFCVGENPMPLDHIISCVKQEWAMALITDPEGLPVKVQIIFAHCYGHVHQAVEIDKFEVIDFTTIERPRIYCVKIPGGTYHNIKLTKFVEQSLGPEIRHLDDSRGKSEQTENTEPLDSGVFADISDSGPPSQNFRN